MAAARFLLLAAACAFALGEHSGPENIGDTLCPEHILIAMQANIATLDQACQDRFTNALTSPASFDNWFASMVYLCPCYRALSDTELSDSDLQAFDCRTNSDADHTVKYEIEWSKLEAQAETCKPIHGEPNSIHGSDSGLHLSSNAAKIIFGPNGECELRLESGKLVSNCKRALARICPYSPPVPCGCRMGVLEGDLDREGAFSIVCAHHPIRAGCATVARAACRAGPIEKEDGSSAITGSTTGDPIDAEQSTLIGDAYL